MTTARPSGEIFTSVKPTKLKNSSSVSLGLSVAWVGRTESSSSKTTRPRIFMGDRFISANLGGLQYVRQETFVSCEDRVCLRRPSSGLTLRSLTAKNAKRNTRRSQKKICRVI